MGTPIPQQLRPIKPLTLSPPPLTNPFPPRISIQTDPRPAPIEHLSVHAPNTIVATVRIRHLTIAVQIPAMIIAPVPSTPILTTHLLQTMMITHPIHVITELLVALGIIRLQRATCVQMTPLVRTYMTLNMNLHVTLPHLSQLPVAPQPLLPYRLKLAQLPPHQLPRLRLLKIQLRLLNLASSTAHSL